MSVLIQISAEEKQVKLTITGSFPVHETDFLFRWNCEGETYAKLLAHNLQESLTLFREQAQESVRRNRDMWSEVAHKRERRIKQLNKFIKDKGLELPKYK